jgi:hypothetical protein
VIDNALQEIGMQQPGVRHLALHAIDKALGALETLTPDQQARLSGRRPSIFFSHSFRDDLSGLIQNIRGIIEAQGFLVVEGEPPRPGSVSDKVKGFITACDYCLVLMTADIQEGDAQKASEWVRQEAAYAYGQSKKVIRLIQQGVDTEGRIFGDEEYIGVDAGSPGDALVRVSRMLAALKP